MKLLKSTGLLFMLLLSWLSSVEQSLGRATFSAIKTKQILRSESLLATLASSGQAIGYLEDIGGVAFDNIAVPAESLHVGNMQLLYNPRATDGNRFAVVLNSQKLSTGLYDWQLIPIANYAASPYTACFSLYGHLEDSTKEDSVLDAGGEILSYHPAFVNTLMGLRLLQLDVLVFGDDMSTNLPKDSSGNFLLGNGEPNPDTISNQDNYQEFRNILEDVNEDYSSYLICDINKSPEFGMHDNKLVITGQPFYYFWSTTDGNNSEKNRIMDSIENVERQVRVKGNTAAEKDRLDENWLLTNLQKEFSIDNDEDSFDDFITGAENIKATFGTAEFLDKLLNKFEELNIGHHPPAAIYLKYMSRVLSRQPDLFRNINPLVWDAGVQTMRYAAFFRYCKKHFPAQWGAFLSQIKNINPQPEIQTPGVLNPGRR